MRSVKTTLVALIAALSSGLVSAQRPPADQWPTYQYNSNFSPLTQITPENVSRLTQAWTFSYGGGSRDFGFARAGFSIRDPATDGRSPGAPPPTARGRSSRREGRQLAAASQFPTSWSLSNSVRQSLPKRRCDSGDYYDR